MVNSVRNITALFLSTAVLAVAGQITYTEQATASGSLGTNSFTDALVTVTFTGDTTNVFLDGFGIWRNEVGTATVTVAGLGTATFTDSMQAFDNPGAGAAGIADTTLGPLSVLDTFDSAFSSYDLKTAIGPITGAPFINAGLSFPTTDGGFVIDSSGDSTFTARTGVPEPSSVSLALAAALLFCITTVWRSRRRV